MPSIFDKGPLKRIAKVFGTKHDRDVKRLKPLIDEINEIFESLQSLSEEELRGKTETLKQRLADGETLDDILTEAFAVVKEACRRNVGREWSVTDHDLKWDMVPFDVQLMGALVLHEGKIAEMATGEGKTLVAIFPLYLNALTGEGAHLVTVNDYLARRDSEWVGEILRYLGLSVGCIQNYMAPPERKAQYGCDVTYGTNNEFGFDYLRDNMAVRSENRVQRGHHYAIVDEVDSVLIDEARTPLIISGPVTHSIQQYAQMKPHVEKLVRLQAKRVQDFLREAESLIEKGDDDSVYRAGERLLQISRGAPKHKRLFKLLADDPSLQKLIQRVEADRLRDKRMHELDEDLLYAIDEKQHSVNISDQAQRATDRSLFRVPSLAERVGWVDRVGEVDDEERRELSGELASDYAEQLVSLATTGAAEPEKSEQVEVILEEFWGGFKEYAETHRKSELELERATVALRRKIADRIDDALGASTKEETSEEGEDATDLLLDYGWKRDLAGRSLSLEERAAVKDVIHQDYAVRSERIHNVQTLLKAYTLYEKDVEYVIQNGKILIVDSFTGRLMPGRRFSDGLHQALEAKEGVTIEGETQTLATITIQNYFRLYDKLAGMTGTAETEAGEFWTIYELDVVVIPTNRPIARTDADDLIYRTRREKYNAAIDEVKRLHELDLPVLVGTVSVEVSETLSRMLTRAGIKHAVLNAKQHQKEAEVIQHAGRAGAVTIATNMAGRGTDIKLAADIGKPDADEDDTPGGLQVIGTERHESRRIDRQLRGRSGRQGDPGMSRFFISLEDDLMRKFRGERIAGLMTRLGAEEGEALEHSMITKSVERAQKRVEAMNFDIRKNLLEYDNVMNQQREIVYERRNAVLDGADTSEEFREMIREYVTEQAESAVGEAPTLAEADLTGLFGDVETMFLTPIDIDPASLANGEELVEQLVETALEAYGRRQEHLGADVMREVERHVLLRVIDEKWRDHLYEVDQLKSGIGWQSVGGKDPILAYKKEAYDLFVRLNDIIRDDAIKLLFRVQVQVSAPPPPVQGTATKAAAPEAAAVGADPRAAAQAQREQMVQQAKAAQAARTAAAIRKGAPEPGGTATKPAATIVGAPPPPVANPTPAAGGDAATPQRKSGKKVGRNDPCPCGSGKKYKKCHGA